MHRKALLLSIRPKYAEKIFNGSKRVELRKTRPNVNHGDIVFVYVSSPVKVLEGTFRVTEVIEHPVEQLWTHVKHDAGVTHSEFDEYYKNSEIGYAIHLQSPVKIANPLRLDQLREMWKGFHPPQGYKYLNNSELQLISMA